MLDKEDREIYHAAAANSGEATLSKEEIWKTLETKRFDLLKDAAVNLQSDMLYNNRCPKCTLQPPCRHYRTVDEILHEAQNFIQSKAFKQHLSPRKRDFISKVVRD